MQRRVRNLPLAERLPGGVRRRLGPTGGPPTAPQRRRRVSRREREQRRQRQLRWGMSIIGALVALILGIGLLNEYVIKPRRVLATVEGTEIRRRDYWKVRTIDLFEQANQYSQIAQFSEGEQAQQYNQLAANAVNELDNVWGSTSVDDATLNRMIEDQLYLKNLDELNVSISDQDVQDYIDQRFAPPNTITTPTPSPTFVPARAAAATETAQADATATAVADASARANAPAPTSGALPVPPALAGVASPSGAADAAGTPAGSPAAGTPATSPTAEATPNEEQARATAAAGFEEYRDNVFDEARLSRDEYERWIARPAVARQEVDALLEAQVGQTAEQVRAAHILVDTQDLANQTFQELQAPDANFEQIARERSTDTSTAPNGGDLGWFARGAMVEPFENVAFAQPPGSISQPFESEFGWHIVKVYEKQADRALSDEQIRNLQQDRVADWLAERRAEADISAELDPTPTPATQQFQPPPDAPPLPTATAAPVASPVAPLIPTSAAGVVPTPVATAP